MSFVDINCRRLDKYIKRAKEEWKPENAKHNSVENIGQQLPFLFDLK